jgi:hypothetical protein
MSTRVRNAPKGERTVYVDHGIWQDGERIHVTILGDNGGHFSLKEHNTDPYWDRMFKVYRQILIDQGRWIEL